MKFMKRNWHYLLAEPFTWLFYYFTQPTRFKQVVEAKNLSERINVADTDSELGGLPAF